MKHSEETEFAAKLRLLVQQEKEQWRCRTIEKEKLAAILRSLVQYEALQTHRRISWLGTFNGLLFASLALGWGKNACLAKLTACVGTAVSLLVLWGLITGARAGRRIRKRWRDLGPEGEDPTEVFGYYPRKVSWVVFPAPEMFISFIFAVAWCFIFHFVPADLPKNGLNEIGQTNRSPVSIVSPTSFAGTNR